MIEMTNKGKIFYLWTKKKISKGVNDKFNTAQSKAVINRKGGKTSHCSHSEGKQKNSSLSGPTLLGSNTMTSGSLLVFSFL